MGTVVTGLQRSSDAKPSGFRLIAKQKLVRVPQSLRFHTCKDTLIFLDCFPGLSAPQARKLCFLVPSRAISYWKTNRKHSICLHDEGTDGRGNGTPFPPYYGWEYTALAWSAPISNAAVGSMASWRYCGPTNMS